jgi:WXG100 family type VII secretion target
MTTYQVSMEQMDFVGGEMNAISQNISKTLAALDDGAKQNLAAWSDDAKDAYTVAKAKWDAAALEMQNQVVKAQQGLVDIGGFYTSGEKYGVSLWEG